MKRIGRILFTFIFVLQSIAALAQYRIQGVVTDSIGIPIDAAVVVLMNPETGVSIRQGITFSDGKYSMDVAGDIQIYVVASAISNI